MSLTSPANDSELASADLARPMISIPKLMALLLPTAAALYGNFQGVQQILAPARVQAIDPSGKIGDLAVLTMICAVTGILGLTVGGAASDATSGRWGRRAPWLVAMGALGYTGFNALFYVAAHATTAINLSIIQGVVPAIVLVGAYFWLGAPVTARQALGVAATILGVVAIACEGEPAKLLSLVFNHGDVLMVAAAVIYAAYTLALAKKPIVKPFSLLAGFALAALMTSLPLVAWEVASGGFVPPTATGIFALAYAAIGPAFISQALFMRGVELIGPGRAGVYVNLVPVYVYPAGHAFNRDADPTKYHAASAKLAWERTLAFFGKTLA